jgi:DNA-binding SARP family transcriptional activator
MAQRSPSITPIPEAYPGSALRVCLLGPFECVRDGSPVSREEWRTRQTQTLFKLLLTERGQVVPIDQLVEAIWPGGKAAAARHSLQVAISTLRLVLEPGLARAASSSFIQTERGGYRFEPDNCSVDVDTFLAAHQRAAAAERRGDAAGATEACLEAAALYRGEYLADDPYAEWALGARERLKSIFLDNIDRLSALLAARAEWDQAITWIERALMLDPFREELYRQLMRAHLARGRRSHALVAFEQCRRLLQTELGVPPSPETIHLRNQIAQDRWDAQPLDGGRAGGIAGELHIPFVGRSVERGALRRAWDSAQTEAGRLVIVSGPPGIGKTRLVQRVAGEIESSRQPASNEPAHLHWISCYEAERKLPLAPIARLLAGWFERPLMPAERQRLSPYADALAQLLPQVRALAAPLAGSEQDQPPIELSRLLEALTQAIRILHGARPGALILDDLHWADASTLLWLGHALRRLPSGMLVIATRRSSEPAPPELDTLLMESRRGGRLTELALDPLATGDVDDLLAGAIRDPADRLLLSRRLRELTGGEPLLVVETLREMTATGLLYTDEGGRWRVGTRFDTPDWQRGLPPPAVREMVAARLERLEPATRRTMEAACVIGAECSARLVSEMTGEGLEHTLAGLEELLARQLVRVSDDGRGYAVAHPLIQRAVYERLSPGRRQDWHLRAARAIQCLSPTHPGPVAGQALRHLALADAPPDEIIAAAEQAGDHALHQAAFADAIEPYCTARRLLAERLPEAHAMAGHARIGERLAEALAGAGRWQEAETLYHQLIDTTAFPLERSRLRRKLAAMLGDVLARFDEALELLEAAESDNDSAVDHHQEMDVERGMIASARAIACFFRSDYRAVVEHGGRALALLSGRPGIEREEIALELRIGQAEQRLGLLEDAERRYRRSASRALARGDRYLEAGSIGALAAIHAHRGRLEESLAGDERVAELAIELGQPKREIIGLTNRAHRLLALGRLQDARVGFEAVIARAEDLDARYTVMHATVGLGETLVRLGEFERARRALQRGIELAEKISSRQRLGHAQLHLAEITLLEGDPAAAHAWAQRGIATGRAIDDAHALREGFPLLAQALVALGDVQTARRVARDGLELATAGGFVLSRGRNLVALGRVLAAAGSENEASAALDEAESIFRGAGARYDLLLALIARASLVSDDLAHARLVAEARELAAATGAQYLASQIDARLDPRR